ncbi:MULTISPECIES: ABC transporter permease [Shouchella]|uniref:ABC transporter permease n=2 Tax=Shouchella TaxID=2893057 RepID=A0ABY7W4C7_9BACI|nr:MULTISPECIES: ABC transporter permease [Shouchella]MED4129363.1 ABC transporter permease [Shouchella miscanthi]WDF02459.1 ABC transporter permease [Shouchella hunanensis]
MTTAIRRIVFIAMIVAIWEITSRVGNFPPGSFPPLLFPLDPGGTTVINTFVSGLLSGQILTATGITLGRLLLGFTIAIIVGLTLGYLIARYKLVDDTLGFLVTALQSIPSIVWLPLAIIWFGYGNASLLFIVTIGATWTVTVSSSTGFKNVPTLYMNVAKTLGSGGSHLLRTVILPASVPHLISGVRTAWAFAWRAIMAGELFVAAGGLGYLLTVGRSLGQMDLVLSVMIVIGIIGTIVDNLVFLRVERSVQKKWGLKPGLH